MSKNSTPETNNPPESTDPGDTGGMRQPIELRLLRGLELIAQSQEPTTAMLIPLTPEHALTLATGLVEQVHESLRVRRVEGAPMTGPECLALVDLAAALNKFTVAATKNPGASIWN